ncbi:MAG TPA: DUF4386 domain-containing protein [Chthoniobacterales bacterium]
MNAHPQTHDTENPATTGAGITRAQQTAAKLVGALYLIQMALAVFGEVFVRGRLIVPRDAVQTAANIRASETLFRLGLAGDLLIYTSLIVLIWGLYVILKPINRDGALLGAFFRIAEQAILATTTLTAFIALRLLGGAAYLQGADPTQLQVLARVFLSIYGLGLSVGFVFLGLGSAAFSYVWLKSGYIPRALAWLGIVASLLLTLMSLVTIVFPRVYEVLGMSYMLPMGLYEVGLGLWLLIKGLKTPLGVKT